MTIPFICLCIFFFLSLFLFNFTFFLPQHTDTNIQIISQIIIIKLIHKQPTNHYTPSIFLNIDYVIFLFVIFFRSIFDSSSFLIIDHHYHHHSALSLSLYLSFSSFNFICVFFLSLFFLNRYRYIDYNRYILILYIIIIIYILIF